MNRGKEPLRPVVNEVVLKEFSEQVFMRDDFTCQVCGAEQGDPSVFNPKRPIRLKVDFITHSSKNSQNVPGNLRTECTDCYEGLRFVALPNRNRIELFSQIRRARVDDQLAVLEWLQRRFKNASESKQAVTSSAGKNAHK